MPRLPNDPRTISTRYPVAVKLALRRDYVNGLGTVRECALKHGVNPDVAAVWSSRGNWSVARSRLAAEWKRTPKDFDQHSEPVPASPQGHPGDAEAALARVRDRIEKLEAHMVRLDDLLEAAENPDAWHKLTTARQRIFDQWARLTALPREACRRPVKESSRPRRPSVAPLDPVDGKIVGLGG